MLAKTNRREFLGLLGAVSVASIAKPLVAFEPLQCSSFQNDAAWIQAMLDLSTIFAVPPGEYDGRGDIIRIKPGQQLIIGDGSNSKWAFRNTAFHFDGGVMVLPYHPKS